MATALDRAGCALAPDVAGFMAANSGDLIAGMLPRVVNAMAGLDEDVVLILDDFHYVQSAACREQVEFLIENLPERPTSSSSPARTRVSGWAGCAPRACSPRSVPSS